MSDKFPFSRKDILERIHAAQPRVASMAGRKIINELAEDIRGAQEIDDTEYDLLLIYIGLLAELSRRHTDSRMEWMRLRRDVLTSQDEDRARELTLGLLAFAQQPSAWVPRPAAGGKASPGY